MLLQAETGAPLNIFVTQRLFILNNNQNKYVFIRFFHIQRYLACFFGWYHSFASQNLWTFCVTRYISEAITTQTFTFAWTWWFTTWASVPDCLGRHVIEHRIRNVGDDVGCFHGDGEHCRCSQNLDKWIELNATWSRASRCRYHSRRSGNCCQSSTMPSIIMLSN